MLAPGWRAHFSGSSPNLTAEKVYFSLMHSDSHL